MNTNLKHKVGDSIYPEIAGALLDYMYMTVTGSIALPARCQYWKVAIFPSPRTMILDFVEDYEFTR